MDRTRGQQRAPHLGGRRRHVPQLERRVRGEIAAREASRLYVQTVTAATVATATSRVPCGAMSHCVWVWMEVGGVREQREQMTTGSVMVQRHEYCAWLYSHLVAIHAYLCIGIEREWAPSLS